MKSIPGKLNHDLNKHPSWKLSKSEIIKVCHVHSYNLLKQKTEKNKAVKGQNNKIE